MNRLQDAIELETKPRRKRLKPLRGAELLEYMVVAGAIVLIIIGVLNTAFQEELNNIVKNILKNISDSTNNLGAGQ
jgi:Flp pilus assembly pilin Flp